MTQSTVESRKSSSSSLSSCKESRKNIKQPLDSQPRPSLFLYALVSLILSAVLIPGSKSSPPQQSSTRGENSPNSLANHQVDDAVPVRGRPLDSFSPDALYQTFLNAQQEYQSIVMNPALPWKTLQNVDDVHISMLDRPDDPSCPYMRLQVTLPVPMAKVQDFLAVKHWNATMPIMDPLYYKHVHILDTAVHRGAEMVLCQKTTKRILTFGPRDFVFVVTTLPPFANGTRLAATVSVTHDTLLPRRPDHVRAFQDSFSVYTPLYEKGREATQVTIVCRLDLNDSGSDGEGGWMPMWLYVQLFGTTGLQSMKRLRRALQQQTNIVELPPHRQEQEPRGGWRSSLLGVQDFVS